MLVATVFKIEIEQNEKDTQSFLHCLKEYYDFTPVTVTIVTQVFAGSYGYHCNFCKGNQSVKC